MMKQQQMNERFHEHEIKHPEELHNLYRVEFTLAGRVLSSELGIQNGVKYEIR